MLQCSIVRPIMAAAVTPGTLVLTLTTVARLAAAAGDGLARGWHQGEGQRLVLFYHYHHYYYHNIITITVGRRCCTRATCCWAQTS